jgi:hypothetical protein
MTCPFASISVYEDALVRPAPVVGNLLVVKMPDARNQRMMALIPGLTVHDLCAHSRVPMDMMRHG